METTLTTLWANTLARVNLKAKHSWIIKNSLNIIPIIKRINRSSSSQAHIETYDFTTLYTNIQHTDLKLRLNNLINNIYSLKHNRAEGAS